MPPTTSDLSGRLFIAVPLTAQVRTAIVAHLARNLPPAGLPGRRVAAENWHLTMRFLGDTAAAAAQEVDRGLRAAVQEGRLGHTFELAFTGLGTFPRPANARVVWLGTGGPGNEEGAGRLAELAAVAGTVVRSAGWPPEDRPFAAHLTLSRLNPQQDVRPMLAAVPAFNLRMNVDQLLLFRSHLDRGPVSYEVLSRYPLGATPESPESIPGMRGRT